MGYFGFLLLSAYHQASALSIALAVVCLYYFGGLIFHLFPTEVKSSWEGHVFGFFSGVAAAYLLPYFFARDPQLTRLKGTIHELSCRGSFTHRRDF